MMNSILTSADYHAIIKTIVTVFSLRKQSYRVTECQMALLRCLALFCFLPAKCGLKYIISGRENLQKGELRYVENDRHRSCCVQGL